MLLRRGGLYARRKFPLIPIDFTRGRTSPIQQCSLKQGLRMETRHERGDLSAVRTPSVKSSGCSYVPKYPSLSTSFRIMSLCQLCSVQLRGTGQISPGNIVAVTGFEISRAFMGLIAHTFQ